MMPFPIKTVFLMAMLGLGALAASVPAALAASGTGSEVVQAGYRNGFHGRDAGWAQMRDHGRDRYHRRGPHRDRGRCAPWLAAQKAQDAGLRRARIVEVSPRRIVVAGLRYSHIARISFANVRGCPRISR